MRALSEKPLRGVCVLSDGIRGHLFQSRGVAGWLLRDFGLEGQEFDVPRLRGWRRGLWLKIWALALRSGNAAVAARWLVGAGGAPLRRRVEEWAQKRGVPLSDVLLLSAGSGAAPFSLALARSTGARCVTLMTPSVLGTAPFDAAVVPRHDAPVPSSRTFVTLGAPNAVDLSTLAEAGEDLLRRFPPRDPEGFSSPRERWALLLGGDDGNYRISPPWVERCLEALLSAAAARGADVYITTSRRTSAEAEEALIRSVGTAAVRMCLLASRDPWNPVPGMLGAAHRVFCTEDSVSMMSEAISGGHRVGLLRVERRGGVREWCAVAGATLTRWGVWGENFLGGAFRFDALFEEFLRRGYAVAFDEDPRAWPWDRVGRFNGPPLNEARRAAAWLMEFWGDRSGHSPQKKCSRSG